MESRKIIVADDEPDMLDLVCRALKREGFVTDPCADGQSAWEAIRDKRPAMAILDLMMPVMTGLEVCRAVRAEAKTAHVPLIMLSARTAEVDRIVAFELGVDDYVTKPFSPRELILRVKAILRANSLPAPAGGALEAGDIRLDREARSVAIQGTEVLLTAIEFKLLRYFMEAPERVHSREDLLEKVWGGERVEVRTVDTQVRRLRARLGDAADQIETVRAFGYRLTSGSPS